MEGSRSIVGNRLKTHSKPLHSQELAEPGYGTINALRSQDRMRVNFAYLSVRRWGAPLSFANRLPEFRPTEHLGVVVQFDAAINSSGPEGEIGSYKEITADSRKQGTRRPTSQAFSRAKAESPWRAGMRRRDQG